MSKIKEGLLAQIAAKVKRKKELKEEIASRDANIEAFTIKFINDLEEMIANTANTSLVVSLSHMYAKGFEGQVKVLDPQCEVSIQWLDREDGIPQVNGILIKWSTTYQQKNNCDAERFIDVASLLFH